MAVDTGAGHPSDWGARDRAARSYALSATASSRQAFAQRDQAVAAVLRETSSGSSINPMSTEDHPAHVPVGVGLAGLREAAANCRACELWEPATQTVFGEGPETARIVFVGEQPGDQEDRKGEPFVGPAGRLLDRALADAEIDRREAYVTNAVKHFRFKAVGKRRIHATPGPEHMRACRPWLEAEFAVLQPEVVVCLGATAAKALISPSFRITRDRGQLIPWTPPGAPEPTEDDDEDAPHQTWMLATTHPSAILRTPDEARGAAYGALVADLTVVAHALA